MILAFGIGLIGVLLTAVQIVRGATYIGYCQECLNQIIQATDACTVQLPDHGKCMDTVIADYEVCKDKADSAYESCLQQAGKDPKKIAKCDSTHNNDIGKCQAKAENAKNKCNSLFNKCLTAITKQVDKCATKLCVFTMPPPPPPTLTFTANPSQIVRGNISVLSWSSKNTSSCTASGGWSGKKNKSGTETVKPLTTTAYSLECTGKGGKIKKTVRVSVSPQWPPDEGTR